MTDRHPIFCDCHGRAKMAEREDGRIIVRDKQFGETHTLVIDIEKEYNRLKSLERQ